MGLREIQHNERFQILLGLLTGIVFGFLLQKAGATEYEVILGQLLLRDFTVVKIMLSAILTGMLGVHAMRAKGLIRLHYRRGSLGSTVIGGLIFGAGFAILGYCPGTAAGAFGSGALDAAMGMGGIVMGAGIFAHLYPTLENRVLNLGPFRALTIPELINLRPRYVVPAVGLLMLLSLFVLELIGL